MPTGEDGVMMVRCADDVDGPRLGVLSSSNSDRLAQASNTDYGIPRAQPIREPAQNSVRANTLYDAPPPAPVQAGSGYGSPQQEYDDYADYDSLPSYTPGKRYVRTANYQSNYGVGVPIKTVVG